MPRYDDVTVRLSDVDGNAFNILAIVSEGLRRGGYEEEINSFFEEATSDDYEHLLQTCFEWVNVE